MVAKKDTVKKSKPKVNKSVVVRSKRKRAIARASIKKGKGVIRVNNMLLEAISNPYARMVMSEPLTIVDQKLANSVDIDINVYGGGAMGQAQAVRTAIARAFVEYTNDMGLRQMFYDRDKYMIVEDSRRVEPKKYKGPKARARFQKSYR